MRNEYVDLRIYKKQRGDHDRMNIRRHLPGQKYCREGKDLNADHLQGQKGQEWEIVKMALIARDLMAGNRSQEARFREDQMVTMRFSQVSGPAPLD
jgi:hypothetical protein